MLGRDLGGDIEPNGHRILLAGGPQPARDGGRCADREIAEACETLTNSLPLAIAASMSDR
jgi:hypothetical protein